MSFFYPTWVIKESFSTLFALISREWEELKLYLLKFENRNDHPIDFLSTVMYAFQTLSEPLNIVDSQAWP
jgi:hypothetical protein